MSNIERTLSIIKPDAVERKLDNEIKDILNKLKDEGEDINLLYDLLSLYKQNSDILNISKTQSKIMRACFKDKSIKFCKKK